MRIAALTRPREFGCKNVRKTRRLGLTGTSCNAHEPAEFFQKDFLRKELRLIARWQISRANRFGMARALHFERAQFDAMSNGEPDPGPG